MEATVKIKQIDEDCIKLLGKQYYKKEYIEEMMRREYDRGLKKGITIHIAQIEVINKLE